MPFLAQEAGWYHGVCGVAILRPCSGRRIFSFVPADQPKPRSLFFENYEEVNIVKEALNNILAAAKAELEQAQDAKALEDVRVR